MSRLPKLNFAAKCILVGSFWMRLEVACYHPSIPNNAINRKSPIIPIEPVLEVTGALGIMLPGLPISPGNGLNVYVGTGDGAGGVIIPVKAYAPCPDRASCWSCVSIPYTSF
tara:strand:- start:292 stop:627 length:336 start_codon:yes stop_codon:yes gene_type:complete